jgi:GT2 family glycosyltransferase
MKNKIGVGIVTYNRPEMLLKLLNGLVLCPIDLLVVVNDGFPFADNYLYNYPIDKVIQNETNIGVGASKNKLFNELLAAGCEHIFIIEDDMRIKRHDIFEAYIAAAETTGIEHFMFAYHGSMNKINNKEINPRVTINYSDGVAISLHLYAVGSFCYYTKKVLEDVGLMDESYFNAFEHIDHSYRIALKGYTTPFLAWADIANSLDYICEQSDTMDSSVIWTRVDSINHVHEAAKIFEKKFGYSPAKDNTPPDTPPREVFKLLDKLKKENVTYSINKK